jgi:hypothetical protein
MPSLEIADLLHAELRFAGSLAMTLPRGEHEGDMVSGIDPLRDRAGKPITADEHRTAVGPRTPLDVLELVDVIAGGGSEEAREVPITTAENMDHEGAADAARR